MINDFKTAKSLLDKLQIFADAQGYRLAIQSAPFEPVTSETYLQESFLSNKTDPLGLGASSSDRQDSIYQIDIFTPKGQGGKFAGQGVANLLKEEFPRTEFAINDSEQKVLISNVSAKIMPANDTHNWTMVEVDLVVLATNT